jgi:hypothetical protein
MSFEYLFHKEINLYVKGRISREDAKRQTRTAREILKRLKKQPGLILADEVGMGKTFVALAVGVSVAVADKKRRPVVVMVPPSLKEKWPRDFNLFREKCLSDRSIDTFRCGFANRAVEFLKLLDDPLERRKSIIFLTHGAMSRGLSDGWVKLALIQRALYRRKNTDVLKRSLYRFLGSLLYLGWAEKKFPDIWEKLLNASPERWLKILQKYGIDPEHDDNPDTDDDPVPEAVLNILNLSDFQSIYQAIQEIPRRKTKHFQQHMTETRRIINEELRNVWSDCLKHLKLKLPLLILDEAHHLKNAQTNLASLFQNEEAKADGEELDKGVLAGVFERMLFLTATPFQLGHHELCSVLDRFTGVNWSGENAPVRGLTYYQKDLIRLREKLDIAQESAVRLDKVWAKLKPEDLEPPVISSEEVQKWWQKIHENDSDQSQNISQVYKAFIHVKRKMGEANTVLKNYIIRHGKAKELPGEFIAIKRRQRCVGDGITKGPEELDDPDSGLSVTGDALLPFLLAARMTVKSHSSRPVFAEGLSSSFEAFLHTRKLKEISKAIDSDDQTEELLSDNSNDWYLTLRFLLLLKK